MHIAGKEGKRDVPVTDFFTGVKRTVLQPGEIVTGVHLAPLEPYECSSYQKLMKRGAKSVRAFATHAVLSGPAYERIDKSALEEVYVTDTIPLSTDPEKVKYQGKFRVVSIAATVAKMILRVYNYQPISTEFIM